MTLLRLAASLVLALGAVVALTLWRASSREAAALRAQPPTGQFVQVGAQRVHYVTRGSGPDVVLIHGASGSLQDFDFGLSAALATRYRVTAFDRPGFGYSAPMANGDASLAGQAEVLRAAAEALDLQHPILVGQSYGGAVALAWALQDPPPAMVLISAPSLPWPGKLDWWYRINETAFARRILTPLAAALVPRAFVQAAITGIFAPDPVPEGYQDTFGTDMTLRQASLSANLAQVNALRAQLVAMSPRYPGLSVPVELIHGDADTIVPLQIHSAPLSQILPDARLTVVHGAGHMPHHSHSPEVIAAIDRAVARARLR